MPRSWRDMADGLLPAPTRSTKPDRPEIAQAWGKTGTSAPGLTALPIHALRGCRNRRFHQAD